LNYTHCHQQGGIGGRAKFRSNFDLDLNQTKMIGVNAMVTLFTREAGLLISLGDPHKSDIFRRHSIRGGGQMPLFGSNLKDTKGAKLISKWIKQLKAEK